MKNSILSILFVCFLSTISFAQNEQLTKGNIFLETNTSMGIVGLGGGAAGIGNTGFQFTSIGGDTDISFYSVGGEAGYFIMDQLAVKLGLGYSGGSDTDGSFNYKLGAKYYILDQIPVGVDFLGSSVEDEDENPMFLGLQAGYALFLGDKVSIEPGLRYNLTLNEDAWPDNVFQLNVGFVVHL